jgi:hypothetical protein
MNFTPHWSPEAVTDRSNATEGRDPMRSPVKAVGCILLTPVCSSADDFLDSVISDGNDY